MRRGFTLVELLVVISIIVLLLALLMPAMSKALYESALAMCGTNLKAISSSVTTYAFDHKRFYPHRRLVREWQGYEISPMNLYAGSATGVDAYDDRAPLKGYISINKMFNDPLCESVNMEEMAYATGSYNIYSSYALWYGWRYQRGMGGQTEPGMFRLGESITWEGDGEMPGGSYTILAGDYSRDRAVGYEGSSHPDQNRAWGNRVWQDVDNPWAGGSPGALSGYVTWSWWGAGGRVSPLDLNFAMADGSVRRYNDVMELQTAGLHGVPTLADNRMARRYISVPPN
jgi:prepilin-type N-terminal cleavage/methylation domain-containing protein